jgi:hypothetical protein
MVHHAPVRDDAGVIHDPQMPGDAAAFHDLAGRQIARAVAA